MGGSDAGKFLEFVLEVAAVGEAAMGGDGNLNEIILMSSGNKLGYSKNPRTLKCFRCHFYVPANSSEVLARSFVIEKLNQKKSLDRY